MRTNAVPNGRFDLGDIKVQGARPVIEIGPVQLAFHGAVQADQSFPRIVKAKTIGLGIAPGQHFKIKVIIEGSIQQRAIEIEENRLNPIPIHRIIIAEKWDDAIVKRSRRVLA